MIQLIKLGIEECDTVLLCPLCGGDHISGKSVPINDPLRNLPFIYPELIGLRISFYCKQCKKKSAMVISQYKGRTFIGWE